MEGARSPGVACKVQGTVIRVRGVLHLAGFSIYLATKHGRQERTHIHRNINISFNSIVAREFWRRQIMVEERNRAPIDQPSHRLCRGWRGRGGVLPSREEADRPLISLGRGRPKGAPPHLKQPGCSLCRVSIFSMTRESGGNHAFMLAADSGLLLSACSTSNQPSSRTGQIGLSGKP